MSKRKQMHIGLTLHGVGTTQWNWLHDDVRTDASISLAHYQGLAAQAEAAKLDFLLIIDSTFITPDSAPHFLNRFEPLTIMSALAVSTSKLGLVGTVTSSFTEPYTVARQFASLDLISGGRAAWNLVTTGLEGAAGNYGRGEAHLAHTDRYRLADEHLSVVRGLWDSWEDDAFVADRERRVFFEPDRLHRLDHKGEYFSVTGPLNIARSAQGHPPVFQASGSVTGRAFAARTADALFNLSENYEEAAAFYADVKAQAAAAGRDPDSLLVLPSILPIVADTDEQAQALARDWNSRAPIKSVLKELGRAFSYYDFSQHELDAPFPDLGDLGKNSYQSITDRIKAAAKAENLTLREVALRFGTGLGQIVGSAETVADELQRWFENGAADGFILNLRNDTSFKAFAEKVVPVLQARGLFRTDYEADTLRGHLGLAPVANRYTLARQSHQE
ncbi:MAG: LLM class flavin-dependent oxidoreductase [Asticcacaulis sp.]